MKFLATIILTIFLGLMFVSLFHISSSMNMSHTMSGMNDCPFMADKEVLCSMNLNEHIGAWKAIFTNLIPSAFTLLLSLSVAVLMVSVAPHLLTKPILHLIPIRWYPKQHKTYSHTVRPYQELFSSGILHPKLF